MMRFSMAVRTLTILSKPLTRVLVLDKALTLDHLAEMIPQPSQVVGSQTPPDSIPLGRLTTMPRPYP